MAFSLNNNNIILQQYIIAIHRFICTENKKNDFNNENINDYYC